MLINLIQIGELYVNFIMKVLNKIISNLGITSKVISIYWEMFVIIEIEKHKILSGIIYLYLYFWHYWKIPSPNKLNP